MTLSEIEKIVAATFNILEVDYGLDEIADLGMPTIQEIAVRIQAHPGIQEQQS